VNNAVAAWQVAAAPHVTRGFSIVSEPSDQQNELDPLTREAIDWVVRLRSGEATTEDAEALKRWQSQSAAHEEALRRAAKLWHGFKAVAERENSVTRLPIARRALHGKQIARRAFLGGAIAASAAGYLVVRPPLGLWPSLQELSADYRTAKGEQREITLGPDVLMTLNTSTSVAVRANFDEPRIELISGEAAITTKAPLTKPVVLVARDGRIVATEARYNARCIDDVVSIACLTGTVDVERGSQSIRIKANQQISYTSVGLGLPINADVAQATSWQTGLLVFHDKTLTDVVEEINRYRPGRIVITNSDLRRRIVNATFHADQLDNFLVQAQELFGAKVTHLPAGVTLLS
jgi:transmembrane sensor